MTDKENPAVLSEDLSIENPPDMAVDPIEAGSDVATDDGASKETLSPLIAVGTHKTGYITKECYITK